MSSQYLSTGVPEGVEKRLAYQLEEARRALQDGDPETAEALARGALADAEAYGLAPLQAQALAMKGEALHRQGRVREAIDAYEEALELGLPGREAGIAVAALGRAYRAVGDLSQAVDVVQRYLARSGNGPLDAASIAELQTVLVSVYFERGDMMQAERAAGRALAAAEGEIPIEIKAKAFWDASRVLAEHKRWNEALDFATRARILLEDLDDRRRVARLHNAYAYICLEFDPPRTDGAARHLDRAEEILLEVGGPADLAYVYTERARMALLQAAPARALESADRALLYGEADLMEENRAMFLKGRALGELGRIGDARDGCWRLRSDSRREAPASRPRRAGGRSARSSSPKGTCRLQWNRSDRGSRPSTLVDPERERERMNARAMTTTTDPYTEGGPLRILIVDDHPVTRGGLRAALSTSSQVLVVGEAASGREAVEACDDLGPDVVFMDVRMPGMSGIEATRVIRRNRPETQGRPVHGRRVASRGDRRGHQAGIWGTC